MQSQTGQDTQHNTKFIILYLFKCLDSKKIYFRVEVRCQIHTCIPVPKKKQHIKKVYIESKLNVKICAPYKISLMKSEQQQNTINHLSFTEIELQEYSDSICLFDCLSVSLFLCLSAHLFVCFSSKVT
jgi:hypothetical protein